MQEVDRALERLYAGQNRVDRSAPPTPPRPHLTMSQPAPGSGSGSGSVEWAATWPSTVITLEQQHGSRFESMAASLFSGHPEQHDKVVLFTSCNRAEGRSTLVLTLARVLGRQPGKMLLIDADLTAPSLDRLLQIPGFQGLSDVVNNACALNDAIIPTGIGRIDLLPLRAPIEKPREFLGSAGWTCLLAKARREYEFVLLDGSPLFTGLSTSLLQKTVDSAVLVVHRGVTNETSILRAREVLEAGGVPVRGIAETFTQSSAYPSRVPLGVETAGLAQD